jgi:voltage-dependent potassium channel beta subunit
MKYRRLGRSGVKISEISLGSWLTYGGTVEDQAAEACIHRAYEQGINFFDTANAYRRGEAEVVVGRALKSYPRHSYVLATKAFWPMGDGPNDRGLSRKHIIEQVHASLKRLDVDYIDLFQCHRYDPETPVEETLGAIDDLIRQGKILYAGVSEWSALQIQEALMIAGRRNFHPIISNQPQYSMLERYIEQDILGLCQQQGIGQVVWSPLAQGVLTGKYSQGKIPEGSRAAIPETKRMISRFLTPETLGKVDKLKAIARELDCTMAQLALAWVLRQENVSSCIIGASAPQQIDDNVKAIDIVLTPEILEDIEVILE